MGAVLLRARVELRQRWRRWLALGVLVGFGFGGATAAAIGARRTDTAYPRFTAAYGPYDITTGGGAGTPEEFLVDLERLKHLPQVTGWALHYTPFAEIITPSGRTIRFPDLVPAVPADASPGSDYRLPKLVEGRYPDPARSDEATVSFAAERGDMTVGSQLTVLLPDHRANPDEPESFEVGVRVVGIHAAPGEFQAVNGTSFPGLHLAPAFLREYRDVILSGDPSDFTGLDLQLERGAADVEAFRTEARRQGIKVDLPLDTAEQVASVQKTMRLEAWTLWALAVMLAIVTAAVAGPLVARESFIDFTDNATLRAMGMGRQALLAVSAGRTVVIAGAAAAAATAVGLLGSALTPIGLAKIAEVDPGIRFDLVPLVAGPAIAAALVVLVSALPAWRAARAARPAGPRHPAALPAALDRAALPAQVGLGARLALESGAGQTAVPVRSTLLGMGASVAAVVLAVTFVASLDEVLHTPRLAGYSWDVLLAGDSDSLVEQLARDPDIDAFTRGGATNITIGRARELAITVESGGPLQPVIAAGRAPAGRGEIALGRRTMQRLGVGLGDKVRVGLDAEGQGSTDVRLVSMEVVGRAVVPSLLFDPHEPGEGATVTYEGMAALDPEGELLAGAALLIRFRPGVDFDAKLRELSQEGFVLPRTRPADVNTVSRVAEVPVALAVLLGMLAAAALVQTLLTTVRRRRRDLAILATLGLTRPQLRRVVMFQGTTLALIGLMLGLPAGLASGRWAWGVFANEIGVLPRPATPPVLLLALGVGMLVFAALVALVPAHLASRVRPAVVLRTE